MISFSLMTILIISKALLPLYKLTFVFFYSTCFIVTGLLYFLVQKHFNISYLFCTCIDFEIWYGAWHLLVCLFDVIALFLFHFLNVVFVLSIAAKSVYCGCHPQRCIRSHNWLWIMSSRYTTNIKIPKTATCKWSRHCDTRGKQARTPSTPWENKLGVLHG